MNSLSIKSNFALKIHARTRTLQTKINKDCIKHKRLSTEPVNTHSNQQQNEKKPLSFIVSLLLQNDITPPKKNLAPIIKIQAKSKPRLTLKNKQNLQNFQKAQQNLCQVKNKLAKNQKRKISQIDQRMSRPNESVQISANQTYFKEKINPNKAASSQKNPAIIEKNKNNPLTNSDKFMIMNTQSTEQNYKVGNLSQKFKIHPQYGLFTTSYRNNLNLSTSCQTTFDKYQDSCFYEEFCKYRYMKYKMYQEVQEKQQVTEKLKRESIEFQKHYHDLISAASEQPQNDREKRALQLSKEVDAAEQQLKLKFKRVADVNNSFYKNINYKMPLVEQKKTTLFTSLFAILDGLISQANSNPQSLGQQNIEIDQNSQQKKLQLLIQQIIKDMNSLKEIDESFNVHIREVFSICHKRIEEFETSYKNWLNSYYQNRVLVHNQIPETYSKIASPYD